MREVSRDEWEKIGADHDLTMRLLDEIEKNKELTARIEADSKREPRSLPSMMMRVIGPTAELLARCLDCQRYDEARGIVEGIRTLTAIFNEGDIQVNK